MLGLVYRGKIYIRKYLELSEYTQNLFILIFEKWYALLGIIQLENKYPFVEKWRELPLASRYHNTVAAVSTGQDR